MVILIFHVLKLYGMVRSKPCLKAVAYSKRRYMSKNELDNEHLPPEISHPTRILADGSQFTEQFVYKDYDKFILFCFSLEFLYSLLVYSFL